MKKILLAIALVATASLMAHADGTGDIGSSILLGRDLACRSARSVHDTFRGIRVDEVFVSLSKHEIQSGKLSKTVQRAAILNIQEPKEAFFSKNRSFQARQIFSRPGFEVGPNTLKYQTGSHGPESWIIELEVYADKKIGNSFVGQLKYSPEGPDLSIPLVCTIVK